MPKMPPKAVAGVQALKLLIPADLVSPKMQASCLPTEIFTTRWRLRSALRLLTT